ncbi:MAG: HipA domain-containing protein [Cyclobacteriaceae bacterium]|nr:HipA domain-containing protein [Cyclobacteriaceae bacterium]
MNRCPITYNLCGNRKYSAEGLHLLSPRLQQLNDFPYTKEEQVREAIARAAKLSIQGVQPKLSVRLSPTKMLFEAVDSNGTYIIKPQNEYYPQLPENEDLTMRLAATVGIEVPLHGMIYSKDNSLSYFIKRFDRTSRGKKIAVEDFAQLTGNTRETKYRSSMENVAQCVNQFCTFPIIERVKLFRLTLFSFLCGNEDMHLKNFSLIRREGKIELSPAYDLVNSTIALSSPVEELALPIEGRKNRLTRKNIVDYFGKDKLGIRNSIMEEIIQDFLDTRSIWLNLIDISFLSESMKEKYKDVIDSRFARIF